jgi:hypothetical protein
MLPGCSKSGDGGFGPYYDVSLSDSVFAVVPTDSVFVVLTQVENNRILSQVPVQIVEDSALGDTIRINLTVIVGSYSSTPSPSKEVLVHGDTLSLWYSSVQPYHGFPKRSSNNSVESVENDPRPIYCSVQRVLIVKSHNKVVSFASRLYSN